MSYSQKQKVTCGCGYSFEAFLWNLISVTTDPDLKEMILNGELNLAICPKCKVMFYVERLVIYHDQKKKIFLYVCPKSFEQDHAQWEEKAQKEFNQVINDLSQGTEEGPKICQGYVLKVIFGMEELVKFIEKIDEEELQEQIKKYSKRK